MNSEQSMQREIQRARRERWIAFCIMVGTLVAFVTLMVLMGRAGR